MKLSVIPGSASSFQVIQCMSPRKIDVKIIMIMAMMVVVLVMVIVVLLVLVVAAAVTMMTMTKMVIFTMPSLIFPLISPNRYQTI